MMASTSKDDFLKYGMFASFSWSLNQDANSSWNRETPIINLDASCYKQCTISVNWVCVNKGTYDVDLQLKLIKYFLFFVDVFIRVTLEFNSTESYSFVLRSKGYSNKIFLSNKNRISIASLENDNLIKNLGILISWHIENDIMFDNLNGLLNNEKYTDFKIRAQNEVFNVHRNILSSRCSVLDRMIESDMLEKKKGEIHFQDFDPAVVKELLKYLYTSKCNIVKMPHELFKVAHYLQLKELQTGCVKYLERNINVRNIIDIMQLAYEEQYDLQQLRYMVKNFIINKSQILADDKDFVKYLGDCIRSTNVFDILRFAYDNKLQETIEKIKEFICINHKTVLKLSECQHFAEEHPLIFLNVIKDCFESFDSQLNKLKNG